MTELDIAVEALTTIAEMDPHDDPEGFNEWGEASCFHKSQEKAQEALKALAEIRRKQALEP